MEDSSALADAYCDGAFFIMGKEKAMEFLYSTKNGIGSIYSFSRPKTIYYNDVFMPDWFSNLNIDGAGFKVDSIQYHINNSLEDSGSSQPSN